MNDSRAGMVALAGPPNAGKSTLLNAFVGEKLSIVTPRPQTTWRRVTGIHSGDRHQIVFLDTPGLFASRGLFQDGMVEAALSAIRDADAVLIVVDATRKPKRIPWEVLRSIPEMSEATCLAAVNKIDAVSPSAARAVVAETGRHLGVRVVPVSALRGTNVVLLRELLQRALPPSPFLFPREQIASDPTRFFVAEIIRETIFELYGREIPYATACVVEEFREGGDPIYIQAVLYVEKKSQKGILIGEGGRAIRKLGSRARTEIERFVGRRVYLDLWVKVLSGWRRRRGYLRRLGFVVPREHEADHRAPAR